VNSKLFIHITVIFLVSGLNTIQSFADSSPTPSSSSVNLDDFNTICQNSLDQGDIPSNQKYQYCKAAKDAKKGYDTENILWKVWIAVAGVCAAACAASFAGISNQYVCLATNTAAGIADAVVTRNFITGMTSLMGSGAGFLTNRMVNANRDKPRDIGACMMAGTAAFNVYSDYTAAKNHLNSEKSNLQSAQSVNGIGSKYKFKRCR
jgi:hypothetical protein